MAKSNSNDLIFRELVLTHLERLIGYFYSGMLPAILFTIEYPQKMKLFFDAMGAFLGFLAIFSIGIGIFCAYFHLIGELILYPAQHIIHYLLDIVKPNKNKITSTIRFFRKEFGVPLLQTRSVYELVKNEFYVAKQKYSLHLIHGELHVLSITGTICLIYYFITHKYQYLLLGAVSFIIWLIADTRQHSKEAMLMNREKEEIKDFLKKEKIIS